MYKTYVMPCVRFKNIITSVLRPCLVCSGVSSRQRARASTQQVGRCGLGGGGGHVGGGSSGDCPLLGTEVAFLQRHGHGQLIYGDTDTEVQLLIYWEIMK